MERGQRLPERRYLPKFTRNVSAGEKDQFGGLIIPTKAQVQQLNAYQAQNLNST